MISDYGEGLPIQVIVELLDPLHYGKSLIYLHIIPLSRQQGMRKVCDQYLAPVRKLVPKDCFHPKWEGVAGKDHQQGLIKVCQNFVGCK